MKLSHITSPTIWEAIQSTGYFKTDGRRINPDFRYAYKWMSRQLTERVGPPPKGVAYPVWAWETFNGKKRLDLRYRGHVDPGEEGIILELDIPDNHVLLSDYDAWHHPLNNWSIDYSKQEEQTYENASQKEIESTWHRVFDKSFPTFFTGEKWFPSYTQAVFWTFTIEQVKRVRFFKGR